MNAIYSNKVVLLFYKMMCFVRMIINLLMLSFCSNILVSVGTMAICECFLFLFLQTDMSEIQAKVKDWSNTHNASFHYHCVWAIYIIKFCCINIQLLALYLPIVVKKKREIHLHSQSTRKLISEIFHFIFWTTIGKKKYPLILKYFNIDVQDKC